MDATTKEKIAKMICGDGERYPEYRTSTYLTKFFRDIGIEKVHDGSTRKWWVLKVVEELNGTDLQKVILRLASPQLYGGEREKIQLALKTLNEILAVENLKVTLDGNKPILSKEEPNYDFTESKEEKELRPLPPPNFDALSFEYGISEILRGRWNEIQACIDSGAPLSATIMMGSMLEGFLLGIMQKKPQIANSANCAPKKDGKVRHFADWTLGEMIDVAHEIGWLQLDVKKFSHALRDFRNLIHPYQQLTLSATPDNDTCKISWYVVQAACNDIANWLKKNP
jgi:hypothetical protein